MKRLICWVIGHRWTYLRTNVTRWSILGHLHTLAGCDADCGRCGEQWRDFYGSGITPENEHLARWYP